MTQSSRQPIEAGRSLGEYEITREIGRGSMGIVFEARQRKLNRRVALKVLPPNLTLTEKAVQRFLREAESVAMLDHPNIVPIYDASTADGTYYYAMRFIDGDSLASCISEESQPEPRRVAGWGVRIAEALDYAHGQGVLHRDIKPGNILLDKAGHIHITDFGLARIEKGATLTESGALVGTPVYMSPEQITGERGDVDRRSDVYSLGVTMYELLTGQQPFKGRNTQALLRNILEKEPKRPRRFHPNIPEDLEAITLKAMEKDPLARYGSAGELALDLQRFLQGESVDAHLAGPVTLLFRRAKRHKFITGAALIALVAITVAIASLTGSSKRVRNVRETARQDVDRATYARLIAEARQHETEGDYELALISLDQANEIGPSTALTLDIVDLLNSRALKEELTGEPHAQILRTREEALDRVEEAILRDPVSVDLLTCAGILYARLGDFDASEARLEAATGQGEPTASVLFAWGVHHLRQAEELVRTGSREPALRALADARTSLGKAEHLDPERAEIFKRRASVWTLWHKLDPEGGHGERAQKDIQKAIELDKKDPESHIQHSIVLDTIGKAAEAANELDLASYLLPYNVQQETLQKSLRTLAVIVPATALAAATSTAERALAVSARSVMQVYEQFFRPLTDEGTEELGPEVELDSVDSIEAALDFYLAQLEQQRTEQSPRDPAVNSRVASLILMRHRLDGGGNLGLASEQAALGLARTRPVSTRLVELLAEIFEAQGRKAQAKWTIQAYLDQVSDEDRVLLEERLRLLEN